MQRGGKGIERKGMFVRNKRAAQITCRQWTRIQRDAELLVQRHAVKSNAPSFVLPASIRHVYGGQSGPSGLDEARGMAATQTVVGSKGFS